MAVMSCDKCGKPEDELAQTLKRCAKCGTQKYCSRACQKDDWKIHRKQCARLAANRHDAVGDPSYPWKFDIEKAAEQTIELIEALTTCEGFDGANPAKMPSPPMLSHMFTFLIKTFNEYWAPQIPPVLFADLRIRLPHYGDSDATSFFRKIEKLERESTDGFDRLGWPPFDEEKHGDALSRNVLSCLIVTDNNKRRAMFPGMEPPGWTFSQHAIDVANAIKDSDKNGASPVIEDTKVEVERRARETIQLMTALTTVPGFDRADGSDTEPPVLLHLFKYCADTHNHFWGPNLQPMLSVELACEIPTGPPAEEKRREMLAGFDEVQARPGISFDRYEWPKFKRREYQDGLYRNATLCSLIVDDAKRRRQFPGMAPEGWTFPENVVEVARSLMNRQEA